MAGFDHLEGVGGTHSFAGGNDIDLNPLFIEK